MQSQVVMKMCQSCEGIGLKGGATCKLCEGSGQLGILCQVPEVSGLVEAEGLIRGPRDADYGSFAAEAKRIQDIAAILGLPLENPAKQHSMYMMIVKLVRESNRHKRDNIVDLMGYAQLYLDNCG